MSTRIKRGEKSAKGELACAAIKRTPKAAALTMARGLFADHPEVFDSVEDARYALRYWLGQTGERDRSRASVAETARASRKPNNPFTNLPKPSPCFETEWKPFDVSGDYRALVLQDIHLPYHDKGALRAALDYGKKRNPNLIVFNGDTADFYSISDWDRRPDRKLLKDELPHVRQFLSVVHEAFPKARKIWKDGNHEDRLVCYIENKAPEFWGMPEMTIPELLHFEENGVGDYVTEMRPIRLGKLYLIHGHEYKFPFTNPVNPARGLFLRAKTMACCGHLHQSSQHQETNIAGKVIRTWSSGCLCDLHPPYRPINNWSHGFFFIEFDSSGAFDVQNLQIIDGKVW